MLVQNVYVKRSENNLKKIIILVSGYTNMGNYSVNNNRGEVIFVRGVYGYAVYG